MASKRSESDSACRASEINERPPKLLERVSMVARQNYYSLHTERTYLEWIRRFILFHDKRHPEEMGADEISAFLSHLAIERRVPVVLSRREVCAVLDQLEGRSWLMAVLLYGAGLRLSECIRLRVKDVDFSYRQIIVRDGKGKKDRVTMLPECSLAPLTAHLEQVKATHERDMERGFGTVLWATAT